MCFILDPVIATPIPDPDIGNTSGIGPAAIPGPSPHQRPPQQQPAPHSQPPAVQAYPAPTYQQQPPPPAYYSPPVDNFEHPPSNPPPLPPSNPPTHDQGTPAPSNLDDDPIAALQARLNALQRDH